VVIGQDAALAAGEGPHGGGPYLQLVSGWPLAQRRCQFGDVRFFDEHRRCAQEGFAQASSTRHSRTSTRPSMAICQARVRTSRSAAFSRSPSARPTEQTS
jgi:hypothetical protein